MWVLFFCVGFRRAGGLRLPCILWLRNLFVNAGFKIPLQGGPNASLYLIRPAAAVHSENVLFRFNRSNTC